MRKRTYSKRSGHSWLMIMTFIIPFPFFTFSHAAELDVILVMDSSGSMKKTDPQELRKPAAKLFISLLGPSDRASVVSFSDQGYPVVFLTPVKSGKNQTILFAGVDKISTRGGSTNIYGAIEAAMRVIKRAGETKNKQVIILMSDGKMDLGNSDETSALTKQLFNKLLPDLLNEQIEIHTIAFTAQSDKKLLSDIAQATGGHFNLAKTDKDLHDVYTSIFEQNKQPNMLPFLGGIFRIDDSITEVTIVGSKDAPDVSLSLHSPSGKTLTFFANSNKIKWFVAQKFDLITISKPEVGEWAIQASSGNNKAYIITDLKLNMTAKPRKPKIGEGIMIKAWLEDSGKILDKESLLSTLSLKLFVHTPDNQTHVVVMDAEPTSPASGVYSSHIALPESGIHKMEVVVKSDTFNRKRNFQIQVATPVAKKLPKVSKFKAIPPKRQTKANVKINKVASTPAKEAIIENQIPSKTPVQNEKISIDNIQYPDKDSQSSIIVSTPTFKKIKSKPINNELKENKDKYSGDKKTKKSSNRTSSLMKAIYSFIGINLILFVFGGGIFFFIKWKRNKAQASNDELTESEIEDPLDKTDKAA